MFPLIFWLILGTTQAHIVLWTDCVAKQVIDTIYVNSTLNKAAFGNCTTDFDPTATDPFCVETWGLRNLELDIQRIDVVFESNATLLSLQYWDSHEQLVPLQETHRMEVRYLAAVSDDQQCILMTDLTIDQDATMGYYVGTMQLNAVVSDKIYFGLVLTAFMICIGSVIITFHWCRKRNKVA